MPTALLVLVAAAGSGVLVQRIYPDAAAAQDSVEQMFRDPAADPAPAPQEVTLSPAAQRHPDRDQVVRLLDAHFAAINAMDYAAWKPTVVPEKWAELPEDAWLQEYASTQDSFMRVHRIEPGVDDSLRVQLTFQSRQDPEHAPPQLPERCVQWSVVYPLVTDGTHFRLDVTALPGSALVSEC
ncbi:hypothetical protein IQ251_09180 [Saccharopolyspora sp. HNM0983]|uniref:Uncharacterized protein n=1 Tax=Saccharopolyspora montiporae TaxID=2781240 RepID=A0A929FZR3_9PSEU|nr:hypothetical protein [Saccharopolyspora sp. HNM0983]MBE9374619.1 hypothetical protein [Saccharopolyspora sp. HNM0983]